MQKISRLLLTLFLSLLFTPPALAQTEAEQSAPLLEGLGDHHHRVTTDSPQAQRYFDQGLVLAFGFNHGEAYRSFREAARLDPDCAMCYWGAALVLGPNINAAMDPADVPQAWRLTQKAQQAAAQASEREQAYIAALAERYGPEPLDDRSAKDKAYAQAMGELAERYPTDLDAQTLYVEALMTTTPWDYWQPSGEPKPETEVVLAKLESVLARDRDHPLANHLYIHAVEARHPEWALEEAVRLENLVPGAGHLVHMPAHIYIRVGQYHEATRTNQRAIAADKKYLEQVAAQGIYPLAYVPHNYHFAWATATLEGRSALAIQTALDMAAIVDQQMMRERPLTTLQHYWITPLYALVRFGHWDEVLAWEEPAADLIYPRAVWHYARGMALTRKGQLEAARGELKALQALSDEPGLKWVTVWDINKSRHILAIAEEALRGELAAAAGDYDSAIAALRRAVEQEDALNYDEPPSWHYPVRQSLGAVLLEAGRPADAARTYRQDLETFPENGWSLFGLLEAHHRQGEMSEAQDVARRFREAWRRADVVLTSSRF